MGACECENPMEFGYEVNAEKEEEKNKNTPGGTNYVQNVLNTGASHEKSVNTNTNNNNMRNNANNEVKLNSQNNERILEGVNAWKERFEEEKNPSEDDYEKYNSNTNNSKTGENNNRQVLFSTSADDPSDEFSKYIFEKINEIRENPKSFIPVIQKAKANIKRDKSGICIYKSSVKVALSKGVSAFDEAIEILENLQPMKKLIFSPELLITPPQTEEEIKDRTYMNELINAKVQSGIPIKSFWRDIIKDKKTCLVLMIVDDTGANSGKKRNDILDPGMQCIGIVSKKIGKSFASYVTLC